VTLLELWAVLSMTTPDELDMLHCAYVGLDVRMSNLQ
jgi:hypothetical protein